MKYSWLGTTKASVNWPWI